MKDDIGPTGKEERCASCIYPEEIFSDKRYAPKCEECFFVVRQAKELIRRCVKCRNQFDAGHCNGCDIMAVLIQRIENNPIDSRTIEALQRLLEIAKKALGKGPGQGSTP